MFFTSLFKSKLISSDAAEGVCLKEGELKLYIYYLSLCVVFFWNAWSSRLSE
jgi:hypothetical protein